MCRVDGTVIFIEKRATNTCTHASAVPSKRLSLLVINELEPDGSLVSSTTTPSDAFSCRTEVTSASAGLDDEETGVICVLIYFILQSDYHGPKPIAYRHSTF